MKINILKYHVKWAFGHVTYYLIEFEPRIMSDEPNSQIENKQFDSLLLLTYVCITFELRLKCLAWQNMNYSHDTATAMALIY